jgi:alpha galactosidase C-like protein
MDRACIMKTKIVLRSLTRDLISQALLTNVLGQAGALPFAAASRPTNGQNVLRDLWDDKDLGLARSLDITLPPHGAALYSVAPKPQGQ